jgi:hypothetical protein
MAAARKAVESVQQEEVSHWEDSNPPVPASPASALLVTTMNPLITPESQAANKGTVVVVQYLYNNSYRVIDLVVDLIDIVQQAAEENEMRLEEGKDK